MNHRRIALDGGIRFRKRVKPDRTTPVTYDPARREYWALYQGERISAKSEHALRNLLALLVSARKVYRVGQTPAHGYTIEFVYRHNHRWLRLNGQPVTKHHRLYPIESPIGAELEQLAHRYAALEQEWAETLQRHPTLRAGILGPPVAAHRGR